MSARADTDAAAPRAGWDRLPPALRPREQRSEERRGRLWRVETLVLLLVFALLAVATINDLVRQVHVNKRLVADLATWRAYTHHDYKNVGVDQQTLGIQTKRDVVCGNTEGGAPNSKTQICLVVTGPTRPTSGGRRRVSGGWYLPPYTSDDVKSVRYGCFGSVTMGRCPR
jgi:cell division protein FtsL